MFNLNFKFFNLTFFVISTVYLILIFTPLYDLTSISENSIYFLYFILGYLIYYIITILKLANEDLFLAKNSIYVEFLKNLFFNKIMVFKKIQNFYLESFAFFIFFINIFLSFFFLVFLKNNTKHNVNYAEFTFFNIFSENFVFDNTDFFEKLSFIK